MDYPGKVITKNQVTPTQTSASGNWTLDDAAAAIKNNNWPVAGVPNPISKSLRFNSADTAYLNRTPASAGNRRTWTWSGWVKRSALGTAQYILDAGTGPNTFLLLSTTNTLTFSDYTSGPTYNLELISTQVLRDVSAWYHIVVAVDTTQATSTNRVKIYLNGSQITAFGTATYPSQNFDTGWNNATAHRIGSTVGGSGYLNGYLTEINFIDGQALTPSSFGMTDPQTGVWEPIKYTGTYGTNGFYLNFKDATSTTTLGNDYSGNSNNWTTNNFSVGTISSKVLEIVDATKSGSVTLSATVVGSGTVNLTAFGGCGNISGSVFTGISGLNGLISDWQTHTVYKNGSSLFTVQGGAVNNNSSTQTATQSRTAQTVTQTGISVVSGDVISITFGANNAVTSYYGYPNGAPSLTISASSGAFIADGSANDSLTDVPTPWTAYNTTGDVGGVVRGNYCTFNPLSKGSTVNIANGNLDVSNSTSGGAGKILGTIGVSSGKWYAEATMSGSGGMPGISEFTANLSQYPGGDAQSWGYNNGGQKYHNGAGVNYGASFTTNDVIGIALDMDAGSITFYKNNVSQGVAYSTGIAGKTITFAGRGDTSTTESWNFGQRPFAYTPPAGFRSLCTTNLPTPTIGSASTTQAGNYFNANLYTGTGSAFTLTGVGFQPDFGWFKGRNASSSHWFHDVVRGANPGLSSNNALAEDTTAGQLTAFASDGYSLPNDTAGYLNLSSRTMVVWSWKGGGTGVTNTAGSVTSTVSANTTAGFSVVTFTAPASGNFSAGHGLGVTPGMVITKVRDRAGTDWLTWHNQLNGGSPGTSYYLALNTTAAQATFSSVWGSTGVTSSVIGMGVGASCGANDALVAYCFAPIAGFSAFGSYTGNGSADGVFVYTGFRPRWVLVKQSAGGTNDWYLQDTSRSPYNVAGAVLAPNLSVAESYYGSIPIDILSNGFKLRNTDGGYNTNGSTYIYAAFAESPFKYALAR